MSNSPFGSYLTGAMISAAPQLLVCVVAIVAGAVFLSRARVPAMLAITGGVMIALSTIGAIVMTSILIDGRQSGVNAEPWVLTAVGWAGNIGRTIGMGCLVGGIFIGRNPEPMPMMGPPGQAPFTNYGQPFPPQKPPME